MNRLKSFFYLIFIGVFTIPLFTACDDDKNSIDEIPEWSNSTVLVVNQGIWGNNNSTLSMIDQYTGEVTKDIFLSVNNRQLGDTGNDILKYGSKVYIAVNISATIEVLDSETLKVNKTIIDKNGEEPRQPRQLLGYGGKVYVTYFDGYVAQIDTTDLVVEKRVEVGINPEGLAVSDNRLYIANSGGLLEHGYGNTLSVINLQSFQVESTLEVGLNPDRLCSDESGNLFLTINGDYILSTPGVLQKVNRSGEIENLMQYPFRMAVKGNKLYTIGVKYDDDYQIEEVTYILFDSNTGEVLENSFLKGDDFPVNPCNIAIDPITGNIWIGSHKTITSYSNEGEVYCFDKNGKLLKKYNVGVGPSAFAFIH